MDRRDIETFLTLAEELHFGRTAERLHLSQASVSQVIKKLERQIGAPLFERTSRQVAITAIGRRLRDDIAPAHDMIVEAVARATAAGRGIEGLLKVGFLGAATGDALARVIDAFGAEYPGCAVSLREIQVAEGPTPLRTGELDILGAPFPCEAPDLVMGPLLYHERRMLAVPSAHPLARRSSVTHRDLASVPVLTMMSTWPDSLVTDQVPPFLPDDEPVRRGPEFWTFQEALALIATGQGVYPVGAQVIAYYSRPGVTYVPFSDGAELEWGLVWRPADETARIRAFAAIARRHRGTDQRA
ncbi:LysR substrate-binding domain-containing protein [Nonomuraea sp. NPDC049152]|uniref:LysR substrate-binding domain-containing protein n=1 Tax=Nonomuraea sp. NPDC049152 TaxID=3154350 RepID=UPI0034073F24